jgi:hypothetical protein
MAATAKFLFVTRTFSTDYRVYGAKGKETFSELKEFAPLRQMSRFIPEDGPGVVLFEKANDTVLFVWVEALHGRPESAV